MVVERCNVPSSPLACPLSPPPSLREAGMSFESGYTVIPPEWHSHIRSRHRNQRQPVESRGELHSQSSYLVDGLEQGLETLEILATRNNVDQHIDRDILNRDKATTT